jgi:hypothetical protein
MSKKKSKRSQPATPNLFSKTVISAAVAGMLAPMSAVAADGRNTCKTKPDRGALLQQFGLVNVGAGQGLRVNIAWGGPPEPIMPASSCDVIATLYAADGSVVAQERGSIADGASHVLDYFDPRSPTLTPSADNTVALRASVVSADPSDPGTPARVTPCEVLSTLEVYDGASGETRVLALPAQEKLADPEPPSIPPR